MNPVNLERLMKLGKLMDRTMADKDGSGPVVPLPPPPPPPLPEPPTTPYNVESEEGAEGLIAFGSYPLAVV